MRIKIEKGIAEGKMLAPPSKSMAHRLLICGAMTEKSRILGIEFSEDILATLDCLRALGARVETEGSAVTVGGLCPDRFPENAKLLCRESGSTMRFFIPLCLLAGKEINLYGSERLLSRPQKVYEDICLAEGHTFLRDGEKITLKGKLKSREYSVRGDISSQFVTGLMFALALSGGGKINILEKAESLSYIDLTASALRKFGIDVRVDGAEVSVGSAKGISGREIAVEGDYSNAAFFEALNVLGGNVEVLGLDSESLQGDRVYREIFKMENPKYDLSDCPDLAPIAFAVAAYRGGGYFSGTHRLKIKESDRAEAMRAELKKMGIEVKIEENSVTLGGSLTPPREPIYGHNDHRIVMAMAILLTITGGIIEGAEAAKKSLPDFFSRLQKLGINLKVESL